MKQQALAETILSTLKGTLATDGAFVALHEPHFAGNEWSYVKECLDTGWVSSVGSFVDRIERDLASFTGVRHAVAVVNGTAALHVALLLAGVKPDDEVLLPTLTFVATANAVSYCGAIPHFVDSDERTLGVDPGKLERHLEAIATPGPDGCHNRHTGRRIKALLPMHTFGHPVDLEALVALCDRFGLALVEDAAESLGSYFRGKHTGHWGLLSAVSFNGNKVITTGGGGAILTNDPELAARAKHLTTTAKLPHRWAFDHDRVGFNYRMPNINAALGCAQLEQLPAFLARKRELAMRYRDAFREVEGLRFVQEPAEAQSNYWLNALLLDPATAPQRDEILARTNDAGLMTRPAWTLMHRLPMFSAAPRMALAGAESLAERLINIPSSVRLGRAHDSEA